MIKNKAIKAISVTVLAAFAAVACFFAAFALNLTTAAEAQSPTGTVYCNTTDKPNWKLIGESYKIKNYSDRVRIFDPNGEIVTADENGRIVFTVTGEYVVIAPDETVKILALAKKPISEISFESEIKETYRTGEVFTLPKVNITNDLYVFNSYQVEVIKDGTSVEIMQIADGHDALYLFKTGGEYEFKVFVVNDRGDKDEKSLKTFVVDEKNIFADDIPEEITLGEEIEIGSPYAYFNGTAYDVTVTITDGDTTATVKSATFTPAATGSYVVKYTANIGGEEISTEKEFKVLPLKNEFSFENGGHFDGLQTLPSYLYGRRTVDYDKGLLIRSDAKTEKITYNRILNLSALTKEQDLISVLPYSENGAYMQELLITFTDIYDSSRSVTLQLWSTPSQAGPTLPNSFCAVKVGSAYTAYNNSANDGSLRSPHGAIAFLTSFMGEKNNCSDLWSVQYDATGEILYITTERNNKTYTMAQYPLLALSDKGVLPDSLTVPTNSPATGIKYRRVAEENYFKGFTTGEVYVSFEFKENVGGGIYINKLAGLTAEELLIDEYDGKDVIVTDREISSDEKAVKGYAYTIPEARFANFCSTSAKVGVKVVDRANNEIVLTNGAFVPSSAGEYTIVYYGKLNGIEVERKFTLSVLEKAIDIKIDMPQATVKFGGYLTVPEYTLDGGIGKLSATVRVLQGEKEFVKRTDGYLVNEVGAVKIEITAKDSLGYESKKQFDVTIENGYVFSLNDNLVKAVKAGTYLEIPQGSFTICENGKIVSGAADIVVMADEVSLAVSDGKVFVPENCKLLEATYSRGGYEEKYKVNLLPKNINSVADYFACNTAVVKTVTEAGINIGSGKGFSFDAPYAICADGAILTFGLNMEEASYSAVIYTLKTGNKSITVAFKDFDLNGAAATLFVCGINAGKISGRAYSYSDICGDEAAIEKYYGKKYVTFSLSFDIEKHLIVNVHTNAAVAVIKNYDDNGIFDGFERNSFDLTVKAEKTTEGVADVIIGQIGNHYFNYLGDIFGYDEADGVGPAIAVYGEKTNKTVEYGSDITVAKAVGFDVLSGEYGVSVTITVNGNEVLKRNATEDFKYKIESFKLCNVIYEAYDKNGNVTAMSYIVTVKDDVCPTVKVMGEYSAEYKLGDKIRIADCEVSDEQNEVSYTIFVISDDLGRKYLSAGDEYRFMKKGVYCVVYRAVDEAYNVTRIVYTITVK